MPTHLVACAYVCIAIAVAWAIGWLCLPGDRAALFRAALGAGLVNIAAFMVPYAALFAVGVTLVCLILTPKDVPGRIQFYCAMLPVLPATVAWTIPFPGLDHLYEIDYPAIVGAAVLIPTMVAMRQEGAASDYVTDSSRTRSVMFFAVAYFVLISLLDFRETTFTNGLRGMFDVALSYGLIVLVMCRASLIQETSDRAFIGLAMGALFVCSIGIMQEAVQWMLYDQVHPALRTGESRYDLAFARRGGELRIPSTMTPIPFGTFMSLSVCIGLYCMLRRRATGFMIIPILGFLYCLEGSNSRGAILGMLITLLLFVFLARQFRHIRSLVALGVSVALVLSFVVFDLGTKILEADETTTFQYRIDLIYNSMDSILRHPLFGTPLFLENPVLELSRNPEGLIDVVNAYLGVVLRYGCVGLLLFFLPVWIAVRALMKQRYQLERSGRSDVELKVRLALCLLVGYAITIGTVSLVDRLAEIYWVLIALSAGIVGQAEVGKDVGPTGKHIIRRPSKWKYSQTAHAHRPRTL